MKQERKNSPRMAKNGNELCRDGHHPYLKGGRRWNPHGRSFSYLSEQPMTCFVDEERKTSDRLPKSFHHQPQREREGAPINLADVVGVALLTNTVPFN